MRQLTAVGGKSGRCTLGGTGTCIVLFPSLRNGTKSVTFRVTSVSVAL